MSKCHWSASCSTIFIPTQYLAFVCRAPESIKWLIEDQGFFGRMIRLHPLPPLPRQIVFLPKPSCASPVELTDGRGRGIGGWRGTKSYDREKAWPSVNYQFSLSGPLAISVATENLLSFVALFSTWKILSLLKIAIFWKKMLFFVNLIQ